MVDDESNLFHECVHEYGMPSWLKLFTDEKYLMPF